MRGRVRHPAHRSPSDLRAATTVATRTAIGLDARALRRRQPTTEIDAYVATGEPLEVAGAFTIDGLGGAFVTGIEGDHHNVVGVSLPVLRTMLAELGLSWTSLGRGATRPEGLLKEQPQNPRWDPFATNTEVVARPDGVPTITEE